MPYMSYLDDLQKEIKRHRYEKRIGKCFCALVILDLLMWVDFFTIHSNKIFGVLIILTLPVLLLWAFFCFKYNKLS